LSNTGTGPLAITSIVIGSTNPGDFSQTNNCGNSVAVNGSCTISVTFTPAAAGARNASLHILDNSNNTGSSQNVTLSGTGLNFPVAGIAPPSLTFANQPLNATSAAQSVTLSNSGTAPLIISNMAFSGANPGDFAQSNNCAGSVAVASSCTISVTFTPAAVGNATATLNVTGNSNNVAGSVQTVALMGATPAPAVVSLSPDSGSGRTETFVATYSDANGLSDLSSVAFLINTEISFSSACVIHYVPAGNEMYLYNDAGTALSAAVVPGSSSSVSNSQCTLSGAASSFSVSGNRLTLRVGLTFAGTFTGQQTVYLKATGSAADSGWKAKGTWTP
jgi:hypothetical protein